MKNNKGQALVEFVVIVPILVFIMMAVIDFSNISIKKMHLENNLNAIVSLYQDHDFENINHLSNQENFNFSYETNQDMTTITLKQNVKIFTPFLNLILGNNYSVETKRIIYNE